MAHRFRLEFPSQSTGFTPKAPSTPLTSPWSVDRKSWAMNPMMASERTTGR